MLLHVKHVHLVFVVMTSSAPNAGFVGLLCCNAGRGKHVTGSKHCVTDVVVKKNTFTLSNELRISNVQLIFYVFHFFQSVIGS